ncbi:hypothetical protein QAD02_023364 [Eretmocerus hayati]|uniref:Uncharacterized protein n=1 Tax=Eretmocerus hayati TaxID=131215 RepID=A0ACC2Q0I2_9HYME|nr:hypothetical protein QAD02_023364 [Eretmocerus hayati]
MKFGCLKRPSSTAIMDTAESSPSKVLLVERNLSPQGLALVDPKAVAKRAPNDLVELAMEIQKADEFIKSSACGKLQIIAEQMRFLHQQAQRVLCEAKEHTSLHHAACNFVKKPGNVYHLYQQMSGQLYFSMLSPQEWGESAPPQVYKGSYRLEHDRSWTPLSQISVKDNELSTIDRIYRGTDNSTSVTFSELMSIDSS